MSTTREKKPRDRWGLARPVGPTLSGQAREQTRQIMPPPSEAGARRR